MRLPHAIMTSMLVAATFLPADRANAQGQFSPFGTGCAFDGQTCAIGHRGTPTVGNTFVITYAGPNRAQPTPTARQLDVHPHLAFGLLPSLPTLLPQNWLPMQPGDCSILVDAMVLVPTHRLLSAWPISVFDDHIDVTIPAGPMFIGTVFFAQWITTVRDSYTGRLSAIATSDAAAIALGA